MRPRGNKYGAKKTRLDGHVFDSAKEARRWSQLCLLERAGAIRGLERQVKYLLVVRGVLIASYRADFRYYEGGSLVIEDVKSIATRKIAAYVMKRKLMLSLYGISIREV